MKRQLVTKVMLALAMLVTAALCFVLQPFDSVHAGPPTPTPTLEVMTLLHLDLDNLNDETAGELPAVSMSVSPTAINATAVITAFADTEIIQGYPAANCADSLEMRAGYDTYLNPDGRIVRSLIRFNVAGIPSGATIHSATLRLYLSSSYDYPGHSIPIRPYRISSPWAVDTVTWNSQPSYVESYPATWITHGVWGWYSFDVADLVRVWTDGTYPNYGIMLRGPETSAGWRAFTTSETIYPPHLVVEYEYESSGFDLTIVPDSLSVSPGDSTSSVVYLTARDGFSDSVTLDIGGLPADTTHEWGSNPAIPTTSTVLTICTTADTPTGAHTFTVTGTAQSQVRVAQVTLQVSGPDFDLSLTPSLQSISVGESALYTAYLTATNGFTDSVALDVGGVPANTTHEWGTNPVTPTTSTVLTITTTADTPTGTHTFTVTGTGGGIVHSAQATLEVFAPTTDTKTIYLPVVLKNYPASGTTSNDREGDGIRHVQQSVSAADSPVSRVALLIGVSDYEHMGPMTDTRAGAPGYDTLFSVHDEVDVEDLLLTAGGICSSAGTVKARISTASGCPHCKSLLDIQATKAAIHAAIVNWLDPLEDENTAVVISFSGHGMYAPDDDGDEDDPYDEFVVPYEIEWDPVEGWRHEMAISDDELASWLSVLDSQHIVILIDSCFSGGMIETASTGAIETKGLSWRPAAQGEVTAEQWRDGFAQDIQGPGRVVLTASAEDQPSWESGALKNGVFTYYLVEALLSPSVDANSNGWISAEEAYDYLDDRVDDYVWDHVNPPHTYNQNPQISDGVSGEVDLTQLGGTVEPCPSWD